MRLTRGLAVWLGLIFVVAWIAMLAPPHGWGAQQQINCAPSTPCTLTGPSNTGTGDPAYNVGGKINANFTEVYGNVSTLQGQATTAASNITTLQGQATTAASNITTLQGQVAVLQAYNIPAGLTLAQLQQQYSSAVIPSGANPDAFTSDAGLVTWNGSSWISGQTTILAQSAIPFILPSSGSIGNNCAITLTTSLDQTYTNAYMYFQPGEIYTGSRPGFYYTVMSGVGAGTCYNNMYMGGQPLVPASPTAFSTTGPGAYTRLVTGSNAVIGPSINLSAYAMGLNGEVQFSYAWTSNNSSNTKSLQTVFGGSNLTTDNYASTSSMAGCRNVRNRGVLNAQVTIAAQSGDCAYTSGTANLNNLSIDTTVSQTIDQRMYLAAATDYAILQSFSYKLTPSGARDQPAGPLLTPASASIVPPGAAALGYNHNKWFLTPHVSDISFTNSTSSALFPGLYYQSQPGFPSTGGYATDVTIAGVHYLALNQLGDGVTPGLATQTQNSTAGSLPLIPMASGGYIEAAVTLSTNDPDHFAAVWALPTEHNGPNGSTYPYVEVDADEAFIFARDSGCSSNCNLFFGSGHSVLNWASGSGSSPTTANNFGPGIFGPNIDRTQEHIIGWSYDPVGKVIQFWLDGVKAWSYSTSSFDSNINGENYYLIMDPATHGLLHPYSMYIRYISAWTTSMLIQAPANDHRFDDADLRRVA